MPKNTIGQFIAILRKANGMTQQDVADRLNVSNKAVSRWERDECSPDLSVIPALAEMFEVTCDELLKGEKNSQPANEEKKEFKAEKQVKSLINRTLSGFKIMIWISLTVSVIGLVCMFGISYGIYRPVIGFAVMLLFEICAFALALLAVSKARDVKNYNELFSMADSDLTKRFNRTLASLSYTAFFAAAATIALSVPLIIEASPYVESVITAESYFAYYFIWIVLALVIVYALCQKPYINHITGVPLSEKVEQPYLKAKSTMNAVQIGLTATASVIFIFSPYLDRNLSSSTLPNVCNLLGLALLVGSIIYFIVHILKHKPYRSELLLSGIRNVFLIPSAFFLSKFHESYWITAEENQWSIDNMTRYNYWNTKYFRYAVCWIIAVTAIFTVIEKIKKRKN